MNFTFHTPTQIHFGCNKFLETGQLVKHLGKKCLVVSGKTSMKKHGYIDKIKTILKKESIETIFYDKIANDAKIKYISNRCIKQDYQNIFQKVNPVFPALKN